MKTIHKENVLFIIHWRGKRKAVSTKDLFCGITLFEGNISLKCFQLQPQFLYEKKVFILWRN